MLFTKDALTEICERIITQTQLCENTQQYIWHLAMYVKIPGEKLKVPS